MIAEEVLAVLRTGRQVPPFSSRFPAFSLTDAYEVAAAVRDKRQARGESPIGRKIGFTNQAVWNARGLAGPIWNYMFDSTLHDLSHSTTLALGLLCEPRIEPEIALHLASVPHPSMDEKELFGCVDWFAHGFEIVHSIFPGWRFTTSDAVAACGVHSAFLIGERQTVSSDRAHWAKMLANFSVSLIRSDGLTVKGNAQNVLGGPVKALQFLVHELTRYPGCRPLGPNELITTGTLTEAMPIKAGECWKTELRNIDVPGIKLALQ